MKAFNKAVLPALIAAAIASMAPVPGAFAQEASAQEECEELEGTPPGLYTTTDEGRTLLMRDGQLIEMGPDESGFADKDRITCIKKPPSFLDWPCTTQAAQSRMFNTYTIDQLTSGNKLGEIVERYFEVPEVLAPIPNYIDGEFNGVFQYDDLIQFSSPEYWYFPDPNTPILGGKRPKSLLVSLYVGISEVVLDNNTLDALRQEFGSDELPVTFVFNDSNTVPISYFGSNASLEEVFRAFTERGIKLADVPMWWQGDHHLRVTIAEFEKFFDIPSLEAIPQERQAELRADLEANGFSKKSIIVSVFAESGTMAVDQPERIRVAGSMGIERIPTTLNFVEQDALVAHCGPGTPVGAGGAVFGGTTPEGGPGVPPGAPVVPPATPPEEPASDS